VIVSIFLLCLDFLGKLVEIVLWRGATLD